MAKLGERLKIGDTYIKNNILCAPLCAPLAGYTDFAFRKLCYFFGAGLCFTEMVSAKGLKYNNEATRQLLYKDGSEPQTAAQLFGSDPAILREACESEYLKDFEIIDINMGCPVPKVFKNGEGSALLADMPRAEKIISACKKSGKKITVKFRIGLEKGKPFAAEFAKMCEGAGADMLTVHGRTRDMVYAGEPDYAQIAAAKNAVNIPVIANGGVFTREDAERMLEETGADGVMLARAAMYDPHVFAEILGKEGSEWDRRAAIEGQIADMPCRCARWRRSISAACAAAPHSAQNCSPAGASPSCAPHWTKFFPRSVRALPGFIVRRGYVRCGRGNSEIS